MSVKIGFHVPASGGYVAMVERALAAGANTFQFFTRNPRGGAVRSLDEADVSAAVEKMREVGMDCIVAHAPYTLNPCAAEARPRAFARMAFQGDLERLRFFPMAMYNLHPGCHVGQGEAEGVRQLIGFLDECIPEDNHTTVLLETMAGKGSELGGSFEQLRQVLDGARTADHLGVCLDTCHVFDGGYDIRHLDDVLEEFQRVIGLERLKAVHINDSMNPLGSRKDRHARLGEGYIGWETFAAIVHHPALNNLPLILETPTELEDRGAEVARLWAELGA